MNESEICRYLDDSTNMTLSKLMQLFLIKLDAWSDRIIFESTEHKDELLVCIFMLRITILYGMFWTLAFELKGKIYAENTIFLCLIKIE